MPRIEPSNPLRRALAGGSQPLAIALLPVALLALAAATALLLLDRPRLGGIALLVAGSALLVAASASGVFETAGAPSGARRPGRFTSYLCALTDSVGDAIPLAALTWSQRFGSSRVSVAAVVALGFVFVGAYSQVKCASLGYRVPAAPAGAAERAFVLGIGLLIPALFEASLWMVAALGLVASMSTTYSVWKQNV